MTAPRCDQVAKKFLAGWGVVLLGGYFRCDVTDIEAALRRELERRIGAAYRARKAVAP